jgi:hypothetical protein
MTGEEHDKYEELKRLLEDLGRRVSRIEGQLGITDVSPEGIPTASEIVRPEPPN